MRKLLIENLEVYEQHRETVEALIAEARALREEECEIAKIFSRLPETLATSDLFNHFMRDVHMAHEVFQRRIEHLAVQGTADELQKLRNDKNVLNGEMAAVCKELSTTKQEADRRQEKIRELEQNLKAAHTAENKLKKSEEQMKKDLSRLLYPVFNDDCENWEQKGATLSFINKMNGLIHGDIKNAETDIDHVEKNIDWLNNHLSNTKNGVDALWGIKNKLEYVTNAAQNAKWLTKADIKDLPNIVHEMVQNLANISDELGQALKDLSKARNDDLSKARENLKKAKEKYEPIKKRIDKSSALKKLVDYLKGIK